MALERYTGEGKNEVSKKDWEGRQKNTNYMYAYADTAPATHATPLAGRHRPLECISVISKVQSHSDAIGL